MSEAQRVAERRAARKLEKQGLDRLIRLEVAFVLLSLVFALFLVK